MSTFHSFFYFVLRCSGHDFNLHVPIVQSLTFNFFYSHGLTLYLLYWSVKPIKVYTTTYRYKQLFFSQQAKSRGFCGESRGIADTWWRGIHWKIYVVSEKRIHMGIVGNFPCWLFRDFRRFPAESIRIFGGFIGD